MWLVDSHNVKSREVSIRKTFDYNDFSIEEREALDFTHIELDFVDSALIFFIEVNEAQVKQADLRIFMTESHHSSNYSFAVLSRFSHFVKGFRM